MTEFDRLDLYVTPAHPKQKRPFYNGRGLDWEDRSCWCSWQEREEVYPGTTDWYVIPSHLATYQENGVDIGYWIIDVDNHDGDNFKAAIEFLRSCTLPPTLTVRTPSGGLHIYYKAIKEDVPKQVQKGNALNLPIEIKTKTGVIAPNGRDRLIIKDLPVQFYTIMEGSPLTQLARLKPKTPLVVHRRPIDPNYQLPEPMVLPESKRHDTMTRLARTFQDGGCAPDRVEGWLKQTRDISPGSRRITDKEIKDIVEWQGSGRVVNDMEELLAEPAPAPDPLADATLLTGWEGVWAVAQFSTPEEIYKLVNDTLSSLTLTPEEEDFVSELYTTDLKEMQAAWLRYPHLQAKFVYLKDTLKLALE